MLILIVTYRQVHFTAGVQQFLLCYLGHVVQCKLFRGHLEGIIYTAKMVCVCTQDEDKQLKWYCHSQNSPDNIGKSYFTFCVVLSVCVNELQLFKMALIDWKDNQMGK